MNYYIIENRIIAYEVEFDPQFYNYPKLSNEQSLFYEANPNVSISEILAMQLNEVVIPIVTLEQIKATKIEELEAAYLAWQNAGWTDSVSGYTLFLSDKDKINYTQLKSIIFDRTDGTICEVGTTTGWQSVEKTVLYDMLKRYGEEAFATYKKLSDLIIYINFIAQTEAEVNAVTW